MTKHLYVQKLTIPGLLAVVLCFASCRYEGLNLPPKDPVVYRTIDREIRPGDDPFPIDVDSNGTVDYHILVTAEATPNRTKYIFRVQGEIATPWTSNVFSILRELSETEQCDAGYPSVLEASILEPQQTVGGNIVDHWWMIGDFHHLNDCFGDACGCPGTAPDIDYVPIGNGARGYIGIRFVRYAKRHYGWLEVERTSGPDPAYRLSRVCWRRAAYTDLTIDPP